MSRAIEQSLTRVGLPYRLVGTAKFFERAEIKDGLAYLRLIENPFDHISFSRVANIPKVGEARFTIYLMWSSAPSWPKHDRRAHRKGSG